jgi:sulfur-carrier protein adenylyltransferase/sulfurtransferase
MAEPSPRARSPVEEILNLARWAPSGDNAPPWTFSVVDSETVLVRLLHALDNVYEYRNGEPTWLSAGTLIETARIAATAWQRKMIWGLAPDTADTVTMRFVLSEAIAVDPLTSFITLRSVDRCRYRCRRLSGTEKAALETCLTGELILDWHESVPDRWRIAQISATATGIRLRCQEAFEVHQRVIDWDRARSPSGIPARAAGLSRMTLPLMRWIMAN